MRYGILIIIVIAGKTIIVEGESEEKWQHLLDSCLQQFQPQTDLEEELDPGRPRVRYAATLAATGDGRQTGGRTMLVGRRRITL